MFNNISVKQTNQGPYMHHMGMDLADGILYDCNPRMNTMLERDHHQNDVDDNLDASFNQLIKPQMAGAMKINNVSYMYVFTNLKNILSLRQLS